jgi:hypothetical protein
MPSSSFFLEMEIGFLEIGKITPTTPTTYFIYIYKLIYIYIIIHFSIRNRMVGVVVGVVVGVDKQPTTPTKPCIQSDPGS